MSVETLVHQEVLVVRLHGDLDHHSVESIRSEVEKALTLGGYRALVMSFASIDFMDSSGIGLILGRYKKLKEMRGAMALCEINPSLEKILKMSGVYRVLPVFPSEREALAHVKGVL
ncbi:MAG: anti-sigma F factor antagonist [Alicyclobacillaceae bacterium]|uniref:anti-sigma F factor antagonist n=1 Tax=Alicyclobacillus sp. SP_1 TaxID=2942475 RepID=UPI0021586D00|nr:anti-sigma F factor antagonist [Alicyclobacillus sp. SP_1]MCY0889000.1 anti-sigma F factor antagonist [Alicyclobacillaceae bacterium]MCY0896711.1 anti-sigma F factor antagonist [Alicyclobacillaceae bacterium]